MSPPTRCWTVDAGTVRHTRPLDGGRRSTPAPAAAPRSARCLAQPPRSLSLRTHGRASTDDSSRQRPATRDPLSPLSSQERICSGVGTPTAGGFDMRRQRYGIVTLILGATCAAVVNATGQGSAAANEALWDAARLGDVARITAALDKGADINAKSRYDVTPLILAANNGRMDAVKLLIARGPWRWR
ncbi:MAG: ankyrin repeat domain-containing protein [Acidimicrobiia bacterium]|nr:ankyrin repeat domain-containing protein [Acidimicrobiia bacterium]